MSSIHLWKRPIIYHKNDIKLELKCLSTADINIKKWDNLKKIPKIYMKCLIIFFKF